MGDVVNIGPHLARASEAPTERRRRAGRNAERLRQSAATPKYLNLTNPAPKSAILSEDGLEAIHRASVTVLEEIGIDVILPEARERMKAAGADVAPGTDRVRFDRGLIAEMLASVPSQFKMHARNPLRDVAIGADNVVFAQIASAPFVADRDGGRRAGGRRAHGCPPLAAVTPR